MAPGDPEADSDNYRGTQMVDNTPMDLPVHIGMRLMITKNVCKDTDYVNGMGATVLGVHSTGVRVRTDTGYVLVIYPWTCPLHTSDPSPEPTCLTHAPHDYTSPRYHFETI